MMCPSSWAQVLRPPSNIYCQVWDVPCPTPRLIAPLPRLDFQRRIGITVLAKDGGYNGIWGGQDASYPNWAATDEVVGYGFQAVQLWPMVSLTDEPGWWPLPEGDDHRDMTWVYENPGVDLIVLRPMQHSFSEQACAEGRSSPWEGGDWGQYAEDLYQKFGHLDKTIILTNWEADWQIWGPVCREPNRCPTGDIWPSRPREEYIACDGNYDCQVAVCDEVRLGRAAYIARLFEERQAGVEAAALRHPDAKLRVYHMITVNHTEDTYQLNATRDIIPYLIHKPHLIGLSHWDKDQSVTEAFRYIYEHTHYPRYRLILLEIGHKLADDQYSHLKSKVKEAMDYGIQAAFIWVLRQDFGGEYNALINADNTTNPGLDAAIELREEYDGR